METWQQTLRDQFTKLKVSTVTVNVETNIEFKLNEILKVFTSYLDKTDILSKRMELSQPDHKLLSFPKGTITYINHKGVWFGLKKMKKKPAKRRNDFVNQITIDIFVDEPRKDTPEPMRRVNVMIFPNGKFKLAGCRGINDALVAVFSIWERILKHDQCFNLINKMKSMPVIDNVPTFLFTTEMINVRFSFPFVVNKIKLNKLFNMISKDCFSSFEGTGTQSVSVKLTSPQVTRTGVVMKQSDGNTYVLDTIQLPMEKLPKTSFMVFDQSVILSGVDYPSSIQHYSRFINVVLANYKAIELSDGFTIDNDIPFNLSQSQ